MKGNVIKPLELFYCYARADRKLRDELDKRLAGLRNADLITTWYDGAINPGTFWEQEIKKHLETAHIILLLVSSDFIASEYCYSVEMKRAIERHHQKKSYVIPVILRPIDLKGTPFSDIQALPSNGRPITKWSNRDDAFVDVTEGIRKIVQDLHSQRIITPDPPVSRIPFLQRNLPSGQKWLRLGLVILAFLLVITGLLYSTTIRPLLTNNIHPSSSSAQHQDTPAAYTTITSIAQNSDINPYSPYNSEKLVLNDSLSKNNDNGWDERNIPGASCLFIAAAYHIQTPSNQVTSCFDSNTNFSNFTFEIHIRIIKGDCANMLFRVNADSGSYHFGFCQFGHYGLTIFHQGKNPYWQSLFQQDIVGPIHSGLNQDNILAVTAHGQNFNLYINHQKMKSWTDNTFASGQIGVAAAGPYGHPTEAIFSNAKVWAS